MLQPARQIRFGWNKKKLYTSAMRLSHLNALRALEATLRHGNFTAAANELGITPAAVGQRVRTLESYVGRDLFIRTSTGVEPREDALQIEGLLHSGIASLSAALEQLLHPVSEKRLAITLPASFAEHWLTPSISEFYQRNEEVDLRLDASNRDVDLRTEPFDFAIRYGRPVAIPLRSTDLFGDFVLPVCSPEFQRKFSITSSLRSLEGIPLIHVDNRTSDPGWVGFEGWGRAFAFYRSHLEHGLRYSSVSSGLKAAVEGQGLVISGLVEAFNAIQSGQLVIPFGSALRLQTDFRYRLVWVGNRKMSPIGKDFIAWIVAKAEQYKEDVAALL